MQNRSDAYQAVISVTWSNQVSGVPYSMLVKAVARHVDEELAFTSRMNKLRRMPNETRAETIEKGKNIYARKVIDAAKRQGLITYGEVPTESSQDSRYDLARERYVYWRRFARTGGTYSAADSQRERRALEDYSRRFGIPYVI